MSLDEPEKSALKKFLTTPPVKKIDLHFPLGLEVTARNLKGVTIKDALDAIYKQFRKKVCSTISISPSPHCSQPRYRGTTPPASIAEIYANIFNHRLMMSSRPQS
jgi:hypothetical protein